MLEIIEKLPQLGVINQEDVERWCAGVLRWQATRAKWHAGRLHGLGGSEIGAVVRGVNNLKGSGFSSLRMVVESKLMKRLPTYETDHMRRGTALEHLARLAFFYRYGAQQDSAAIHAMGREPMPAGYEWLVGNPDDIVRLGGKLYLPDYKVPSTYDDEVHFDYQAQLHHYGLIARFSKIPIAGYLLVKLDLAAEIANELVSRIETMQQSEIHDLAKSIARINIPGMRVVANGVPVSRDMHLDILDCGGYCWNDLVIKGVVPEVSKSERLELDDETLLNLGALQQQYAMAKSGIKHLNTIAENAASKIGSHLLGVDFADKQMPLTIVNVSPKDIDKTSVIKEAIALGAKDDELAVKGGYSIVALVNEIKRLNGDVEADHLFETKTDYSKAVEYLQGKEVDIEGYRPEGVSLKMSIRSADKEVTGVFVRQASEVFGQWFDEHSITRDQEDDGIVAVQGTAQSHTAGCEIDAFSDVFASDEEQTLKTINPVAKGASMR